MGLVLLCVLFWAIWLLCIIIHRATLPPHKSEMPLHMFKRWWHQIQDFNPDSDEF